MVVNLLTTLGRVTPLPLVAVLAGLDGPVGKTVITGRTRGQVRRKVQPIFGGVIMVVVAAVQERLGQTHRVTAV